VALASTVSDPHYFLPSPIPHLVCFPQRGVQDQRTGWVDLSAEKLSHHRWKPTEKARIQLPRNVIPAFPSKNKSDDLQLTVAWVSVGSVGYFEAYGADKVSLGL